MQDPAVSEDGPPLPGRRQKVRARSARARSASAVPHASRRPRLLTIVLVVINAWIYFAAIYLFFGPDRLPALLASEVTFAPELARATVVSFDPVSVSDRARIAPAIEFGGSGCEALAIVAEARAASATSARLQLVAMAARPEDTRACTLSLRHDSSTNGQRRFQTLTLVRNVPQPILVAVASGNGNVPLLGQLPLQHLRLTLATKASSDQDTASAGLPDPLAPTAERRQVELAGRDMVLERAVLVDRGGKQRLALTIRAQRLTMLEVDRRPALRCWRLRKALSAATFFQVPSLAQALLRATGFACVGEWGT